MNDDETLRQVREAIASKPEGESEKEALARLDAGRMERIAIIKLAFEASGDPAHVWTAIGLSDGLPLAEWIRDYLSGAAHAIGRMEAATELRDRMHGRGFPPEAVPPNPMAGHRSQAAAIADALGFDVSGRGKKAFGKPLAKYSEIQLAVLGYDRLGYPEYIGAELAAEECRVPIGTVYAALKALGRRKP